VFGTAPLPTCRCSRAVRMRPEKTSESIHDDARLLTCVRFLATWLLGGTILGVLFGPWVGMSLGLLIAIAYVKAVHWSAVLALLAPRSRPPLRRRDAAVREQ
jgi:hypothetical protein